MPDIRNTLNHMIIYERKQGGRILKKHKKIVRFKYKLSILLVTTVLFVSCILGIFQFIIMKHSLEDNFKQNRILVRDRILNSVSDTDYINYLIEKPMEEESKIILSEISKKYDQNRNINLDLHSFIKNKKNIDLYIIDQNNNVVSTTDPKEIGYNFNSFKDFTTYLNSVRIGKKFESSRISISIIEGKLKKFSYLPSNDGKYIFETGMLIDDKLPFMKGTGFDNFDESVTNDNNFVDRVNLYDYTGTSYKKDSNGVNFSVDPDMKKYFTTAIRTNKTVEVVRKIAGKNFYYQYIPYEFIGGTGNSKNNAIEVIYNENTLNQLLKYYIKTIILVVFTGVIIAGAYDFYKARRITKPIEAITEGIKQIGEGNFNYQITIESNDELSLLAAQLKKMTNEIKVLLEVRNTIENDLEVKNKEISSQKEEIELLYKETISINKELEQLLHKNTKWYFETVRALANAIEVKDMYTGSHCERVMEYSMVIAEALDLNEEEKHALKFGSILHDIGKIGISELILNKADKLTDIEYDLIKKHPEIGNKILVNLNFLDESRSIIYEHHERIDGKGYPRGLMGDEINKLAKIVCVADAFDAMTSTRSYRTPMSDEDAFKELLRNKGTQFDCETVDAFLKCFPNRNNIIL